jgi:SulP family sulfate permease
LSPSPDSAAESHPTAESTPAAAPPERPNRRTDSAEPPDGTNPPARTARSARALARRALAAVPAAGVLRTEVLSGLVVGLALIPEAISFSVIAGVDPRIGLFSACTMAMTIAFAGGRPAMISASTGAVALVVAPITREYGLGYLITTVILAGVVQIALGALGVARLMRFVPRAVMVGFVNALGVLLFIAQLPNLRHVPWPVYPLVAAGIAMTVLLPRITKAVPAPLVSVTVLTVVTVGCGIAVPTVGDKGRLPSSLPVPGLPHVPLTAHTVAVVTPYALATALVGLMETLMTARLVDELTDTRSDKARECVGQGVANIVTGLFGGMGGCAMIGQTMINVRNGARTRLSTFLAGFFLLVLCLGLGPVVARIPMAALVAVMILVCVGTFDWRSITPATLRTLPPGDTAVMVITTAVVITTGNLSIGVVAGSLAAMAVFTRRVAHRTGVTAVPGPDGRRVVYSVTGDLFFASSDEVVARFDYGGDPEDVVIDLSAARVWDASSTAALGTVQARYARHGKQVTVTGLAEAGPARAAEASKGGAPGV